MILRRSEISETMATVFTRSAASAGAKGGNPRRARADRISVADGMASAAAVVPLEVRTVVSARNPCADY